MKILVLGHKGMLGSRVFKKLSQEIPNSVSIYSERISYDKKPLLFYNDFEKFDVVVNCIGIIKQKESCEKDLSNTIYINSLFPHLLTTYLPWSKIIHISTDCTMSGKKGNYVEEDLTDAEDVYGKTKALGELKTYSNALTLRTSIIGYEINTKYGLLEWFLGQEGKTVKGYTRTFYSGVTTNYLADVITYLIKSQKNLFGLYQVTAPKISKYELLCKIKNVYNLNIDIIPDDSIYCDRSMIGNKFRETMKGTIFSEEPSWDNLIMQIANEGRISTKE